MRVYPVKLQYSRLLKLCFSVAVIVIFHNIFENSYSVILSLIISAVLLLCMPFLLLLTGFFESTELIFMQAFPGLVKRKLGFVFK